MPPATAGHRSGAPTCATSTLRTCGDGERHERGGTAECRGAGAVFTHKRTLPPGAVASLGWPRSGRPRQVYGGWASRGGPQEASWVALRAIEADAAAGAEPEDDSAAEPHHPGPPTPHHSAPPDPPPSHPAPPTPGVRSAARIKTKKQTLGCETRFLNPPVLRACGADIQDMLRHPPKETYLIQRQHRIFVRRGHRTGTVLLAHWYCTGTSLVLH